MNPVYAWGLIVLAFALVVLLDRLLARRRRKEALERHHMRIIAEQISALPMTITREHR